jgi:MarR family transcriptional regulator for hemolysin
MLKYDFEQSVGYWLITAHHAYVHAFTDRLIPHGISFRQAQILAWLAAKGPLSQTELAGHMMIEPPSLVGTLDRMEASGLLERKGCPNDRRKNLVHPLPAAEEMWEQIAACGRQMRSQATEGLTEKEIATLKQLLNKVGTNLAVSEIVESVS